MTIHTSKTISKLDLNNGELAHCYASLPLGYYKELTYPFYAEILDLLGDGIRVLNLGSGCGHFEFNFYSSRPKATTKFVLLDSSRVLLQLAEERMRSINIEIEAYQRSYNAKNWAEDLGSFDAIISHNSLFHLEPPEVARLYSTCYLLLNNDGIMLNQQAFSPTLLKTRFMQLYSVLGPQRFMTVQGLAQAAATEQAAIEIETDAKVKFADEIQNLLKEGWSMDSYTPYASLDLSIETHLQYLRDANFSAECLWRMMHFGLVGGLKGEPF